MLAERKRFGQRLCLQDGGFTSGLIKEKASMKVLRFLVVIFCAFVLLRIAACTTGFTPAPEETEEISIPSPQAEQGQETNQQPAAVDVPLPEVARDVALVYVQAAHPDVAEGAPNPATLTWEMQDVTQPGLLGSTTLEYTAEGWLVQVQYPIVAPESMIFNVIVTNTASGLSWTGTLNAGYQVISE
jgi:hypothetical protein